MIEDKTIAWNKKNNCSTMINQTLIPKEYKKIDVNSTADMYKAIKDMVVRGAPAIGIAGAHGINLAAIEERNNRDFKRAIIEKANYILSSRPTAVNLNWAIQKQLEIVKKEDDINILINKLIENSIKLENDDIEINKKIGDFGSEVIPKGAGILTHCNAGRLATVGYGTALGVIRSAYKKDKTIKVYADETRPRLQGARLTTYELVLDNIDTTLITDNMSGYLMKKGLINVCVTGADRIALNGDTANKIGTYTVAINAKYHNIPFYIAAPKSTIDPNIKTGDETVIELRDKEEVTTINDELICHKDVKAINPSFDITPNSLITGIITEYGIFKPDRIKELFD